MWDYLSAEFMPHGHCYLWRADLVWMHVISDLVITLAYYAIPILLTVVVVKSRGKMPFNWLFLLFAIFILACGTTHLMEIVNVWESFYYLSGVIKVITAIASILTAVAMLPLLPKVIEILQEAEKRR